MKKILFLNHLAEHYRTFWTAECEKKCAAYGFSVKFAATAADVPDPDWASLLPGSDAVVTTWGSPRCTAEFLAAAPAVRILGHCAGSVVPFVDSSTFEKIKVTSANPVMAEMVAQWSLLATMLIQRNFFAYVRSRADEALDWSCSRDMRDIRDMTVGLWGFGDTSRHFLRLLAPLAPGRILVCSGHAPAEELARYGAEKVSLETLLAESDVFHCLTGVNRQNYERIGEKEFALMKTGATFVNCGRARLAEELALIGALKSGRIRAFLDVFYDEPLPESAEMNRLPNLIMTPHTAGFPGRGRYLAFLLDEFHRFFHGEPLTGEIDYRRYLTMTDEFLRK